MWCVVCDRTLSGRVVQQRNEEWLDEATAAVEEAVSLEDAAPAEAAAAPAVDTTPGPRPESAGERQSHAHGGVQEDAGVGPAEETPAAAALSGGGSPAERRQRQRQKMRELFDVNLDLATWDMGGLGGLHDDVSGHATGGDAVRGDRTGSRADAKPHEERRHATRTRERGRIKRAEQIDARHVVARGAGGFEWFIE